MVGRPAVTRAGDGPQWPHVCGVPAGRQRRRGAAMAARLPPQRPDWRTTKKRLLSRHKSGKASAIELFNFEQTGRKPGCKTLVCTASRQTEDLSMAMPTK